MGYAVKLNARYMPTPHTKIYKGQIVKRAGNQFNYPLYFDENILDGEHSCLLMLTTNNPSMNPYWNGQYQYFWSDILFSTFPAYLTISHSSSSSSVFKTEVQQSYIKCIGWSGGWEDIWITVVCFNGNLLSYSTNPDDYAI